MREAMPFARRSASPAGAMTPGKAAAGNADARDRHSASDAAGQGPAGSQATRWYGGRRRAIRRTAVSSRTTAIHSIAAP